MKHHTFPPSSHLCSSECEHGNRDTRSFHAHRTFVHEAPGSLMIEARNCGEPVVLPQLGMASRWRREQWGTPLHHHHHQTPAYSSICISWPLTGYMASDLHLLLPFLLLLILHLLLPPALLSACSSWWSPDGWRCAFCLAPTHCVPLNKEKLSPIRLEVKRSRGRRVKVDGGGDIGPDEGQFLSNDGKMCFKSCSLTPLSSLPQWQSDYLRHW